MSTTVEVKTDAEVTQPSFKYDDLDLSDMTPEELEALGITLSEEELEEEEDDDEVIEDEPKEEEVVEEEEEPSIPKSRFDEAVWKERTERIRLEEKTKALEEKINDLLKLQEEVSKKPVETVPDFNFEEAEEKYADLLLEGETKEASTLRVKINSEKDRWIKNLVKDVQKEALKEARATSEGLSEKEKMDVIVDAALVQYPFLDPEDKSYDDELVEEINALAIGYSSKGITKSKALQKAIDRLAKPKGKKTATKETIEKRKAKAAKVSRQPPDTSSSKKVTDKLPEDFDWDSMSQTEFRKLYKENPDIVREALYKNYSA